MSLRLLLFLGLVASSCAGPRASRPAAQEVGGAGIEKLISLISLSDTEARLGPFLLGAPATLASSPPAPWRCERADFELNWNCRLSDAPGSVAVIHTLDGRITGASLSGAEGLSGLPDGCARHRRLVETAQAALGFPPLRRGELCAQPQTKAPGAACATWVKATAQLDVSLRTPPDDVSRGRLSVKLVLLRSGEPEARPIPVDDTETID